MKKNISLKVIYVSLTLIPYITNGFSLGESNFKGVIDEIIGVISLIIPILFALCFLAFFWGLSKFILNPGNQSEIQKGRNYMIWGALALFVLVSVRAIIGLIAGDLDIGGSDTIPLLPTSTNSGQSTETFNLPDSIPSQ